MKKFEILQELPRDTKWENGKIAPIDLYTRLPQTSVSLKIRPILYCTVKHNKVRGIPEIEFYPWGLLKWKRLTNTLLEEMWI